MLAGFVVCGVVLVAPSLVQAQEGESEPVTLIVTKLVEGPAPAGATFDVQIDCDTGVGSEGGPTTQTITFDASGGNQTVDVPQFQPECAITEIVDGGADSVAYAAGVSDDLCTVTPLEDSIDVEFGRGEVCAVIITNTFAEVAPPRPAVDPADALRIRPAFTG